jgi:transposase
MRPLKITYAITTAALTAAVKKERDARVRTRTHAMRMILSGETVPVAAEALGVGEWQLRKWVHRFNTEGLSGLRDHPHPGQPPKLSPEKVDEFKQRIRKGAIDIDRVCALRGKDIQRILSEEFGAKYSICGVYVLLHRLKFSPLVPRPRHPRADAAAQDVFKKKLTRSRSRGADKAPR